VIRDGVLRGEVAEAARVLARLGLVTAFGHVSARADDSMLITPAADLAGVTAASVIEVPPRGTRVARRRSRPEPGHLPRARRGRSPRIISGRHVRGRGRELLWSCTSASAAAWLGEIGAV
jgi:hypothetical protein